MADKLTITTVESTLTVTDGVIARTATFATATGAKTMAARFESSPELGRRWLAIAGKQRQPTPQVPASIRRIDRVVIIYADTGKPLRTCLCPSLQDAIDLESRLVNNIDFAMWWVMGERHRANTGKSGSRG